MPPKKKGKKGKKKDDAELELEEKCKRTMEEVDALKDQLVARKVLRRRENFAKEDYRGKMQEAEEELRNQAMDQRMSSANMTRQYKSMQTDMATKIHSLEKELSATQHKLAKTETHLRVMTEEKETLTKEKDVTIAQLEQKLIHMERAFENLLHESLDKLLENILDVRNVWEMRSMTIQAINKQNLLEFGLNPLDI